MDILVRTPRQFSDVREYADALMSGSTLMISLKLWTAYAQPYF